MGKERHEKNQTESEDQSPRHAGSLERDDGAHEAAETQRASQNDTLHAHGEEHVR